MEVSDTLDHAFGELALGFYMGQVSNNIKLMNLNKLIIFKN